MIYDVSIGGKNYRVELARSGSGWRCRLNGREFNLDAVPMAKGSISVLLNGRSYYATQELTAGESTIVVGRERFAVLVRDPRSLRGRAARAAGEAGVRRITAPMPGKVVRVLAPAGTEVELGQPVVVIEAMKMQNELKAPKKGKVNKINVTEGTTVEAGQILAEIE